MILAPFRLTYYTLEIPAQSEARFVTDCDLDEAFQTIAKRPLDLKLYWVLPHYHELGNYFSVEILGGPKDGEVIHSLDTFNAEPNGKALDPPWTSPARPVYASPAGSRIHATARWAGASVIRRCA